MNYQHALENLEVEAKDGIVDELLNQGFVIFSEVAKSQWGSYCIQRSSFQSLSRNVDDRSNLYEVVENGSEKQKGMTLDHLLEGLLDFATNEEGAKFVTKVLQGGGIDMLDKVVRRICEPAKG